MPSSTVQLFKRKKKDREPLAMVSLYDAPSARVCCDSGADALLVGDSMGNVVLGYENTVQVDLDDMAVHGGAVVRGVKASTRPEVPVIVDLPFGAWHGGRGETVAAASRLMRQGAGGLKIEGAGPLTLEAARVLVEMGVPVMGHLGYTPQSVLSFDKTLRGDTADAAQQLLEGALALQEAGCFALVLEVVPGEVAARITERLHISTIGIGAGPGCDGQVLVWHDLTGQLPGAPFRFVKQYLQAHALFEQAARGYCDDVRAGRFPTAGQGWAMPIGELEKWRDA